MCDITSDIEKAPESDNSPLGELVNLIGMKLTPLSDEPDIYLVFFFSVGLDFPNDPTTPPDTPLITEDKRILFCTSPDLANTLYQKGRPDLTRWGKCPDAPTATIDLADLMDQLSQERGKPFDIAMFDFLAILIDSIKAIDVEYPEGYWDTLWRLTAHQTASKKLDTFFLENEITRVEILDVINWCFEAIAANCVLVSN